MSSNISFWCHYCCLYFQPCSHSNALIKAMDVYSYIRKVTTICIKRIVVAISIGTTAAVISSTINAISIELINNVICNMFNTYQCQYQCLNVISLMLTIMKNCEPMVLLIRLAFYYDKYDVHFINMTVMIVMISVTGMTMYRY